MRASAGQLKGTRDHNDIAPVVEGDANVAGAYRCAPRLGEGAGVVE